MATAEIIMGESGGGGELEFTILASDSGGAVFKKSDISSFEVKIDAIQSTSYYPMLKASNSPALDTNRISSWTTIKTYTSVTSTFEDVLSLVSGYEYFGFNTGAGSQNAVITAKLTM